MRRLVQLDGLRAIAVVGVILHHELGWRGGIPLGPVCVRLFFVLSGFLITDILLRAREQSKPQDRGFALRSFYVRRILRIFPVYYASLAILYCVGPTPFRGKFWWQALYVSNVYCAFPDVDIEAPWGHLWSLSVEEQFYLVWPAVVLFSPKKCLLPVFISAIGIGPTFRLWAGITYGHNAAVFLTPGCLDSLGLGALLASLWGQPNSTTARTNVCRAALIVGMVVIAGQFVNSLWDISWRYWLIARDLGPALVFFWLVNNAAEGFRGRIGDFLESRIMVAIGAISYGMYLFHGFLPWLFDQFGMPFGSLGFSRLLITTTLTILFAMISWRYFERPLNRLKNRFPYVREDGQPSSEQDEVPELAVVSANSSRV